MSVKNTVNRLRLHIPLPHPGLADPYPSIPAVKSKVQITFWFPEYLNFYGMFKELNTSEYLWGLLIAATDAGCNSEGYYADLFGNNAATPMLGFCTSPYNHRTTFFPTNAPCSKRVPLDCPSPPPLPPGQPPPPPPQPAVQCALTVIVYRPTVFTNGGFANAFWGVFNTYFVRPFHNPTSPIVNYITADGTINTSPGTISISFVVPSQVGVLPWWFSVTVSSS